MHGMKKTVSFLRRQILQIKHGGLAVILKKSRVLLLRLRLYSLYPIAFVMVLCIRLMKPLVLVRWLNVNSSSLGHFAANPELYLCERDAGINVPRKRYLDIFFFGDQLVCNRQLKSMWKRTLRTLPAWLMSPISKINGLLPGSEVHDVGNNTQRDRDVHNLLDKFPAHLYFYSTKMSAVKTE